jgi:hypothetical protein
MELVEHGATSNNVQRGLHSVSPLRASRATNELEGRREGREAVFRPPAPRIRTATPARRHGFAALTQTRALRHSVVTAAVLSDAAGGGVVWGPGKSGSVVGSSDFPSETGSLCGVLGVLVLLLLSIGIVVSLCV